MRASAHARARSDEWHAREHSVGTAARLAIKAGALVLPYPDQPCKAMVIALDGRRRIANLHTDEIITSLPRLPDHFRFATRRSTA